MKKLLGLLLLLTGTAWAASDSIYLPNLRQNLTGTSLGGGKFGLDASIGGTQTIGGIYTPGEAGLTSMAIRKDAAGPLAGVVDGDYTPLLVDANGALKVDASFTEAATAADGAVALPGVLKIMGGWDGTNIHVALMDSAGRFSVVSRMVDGAGTALTSTLNGGKQSLDVHVSTADVDIRDLTNATDSVTAHQGGTWNINNIAGTVSLPTGAATETTLNDIKTEVTSIDSKLNTLGQNSMANSMPVVIASNQSAVPVSATSLPLPTDASTETTLSALNAKFSSLGQKVMANSAPVVISSDQSAIPISGTVTANNSSVAATGAAVPADATYVAANQAGNLVGLTRTANGLDVDVKASVLPTGAATEASLASVDGKLPATLGQKTMANSMAVVISSDQSSVPVDATTIKATAAAAIPSTGAFVLGSDGTNARPIKTNASGELVVAVTTSTPSTSTMVLDTVDASTADANTAPANCRGFILLADADNTADLRIRYDGTAPTSSVGMQLEPGRDTGYVPGCPNIRVISESGTNAYQIAWLTD